MEDNKQQIRDILGFENESGFDSVTISLASPETIIAWSKGEVKNPETINYRTFKPEQGGLFCQKIFGPIRDYECACGKYKRVRYKDQVCERCGVEVTTSRVRRDRMGHIELAVPVSHIWFLKSMPSRLGLVLDMTSKALESVIYYEKYIVIDPRNTSLKEMQLLSDEEYQKAMEEYDDEAFYAKMGAEAIYEILQNLNLAKLSNDLTEQMRSTRSKQIKKRLAKRLKLIQGFLTTEARPEWMILKALPVIPPDLRPLVPLEGGRFATSDLNDLYRRVINRNNRLKNLMAMKTPDVIIHNEKRMLQEAVDALFDNGRHGRAVTGAGNRPLKSISDMLKGKQGRFRQNLLGKRVDYSGRSVIVIGPELKLHQCGLPKKMALTLFEPFIIRRLKELGWVHTVRSARKLIEKRAPEVWDILAEVTEGHPVMLNRAPTLHRLSIQAFEPVLIEGDAIRLHPLVCAAYNADFDGDQMAVHVPLSLEAIMEAKLLMLASNNIFSPSSGKPILTPSQDIVLGAYYLTYELAQKPAEDKKVSLFANEREVEFANAEGMVHWHDWIDYVNPDFGTDTIYGDKTSKIIRTTVGRVLFTKIWPEQLGFINFTVPKGKLGDLILSTFKVLGKADSAAVLDALKALGFKTATRAGISIGIGDMDMPAEKVEIIANARKAIDSIEQDYIKGTITKNERSSKVKDVWTIATEDIAKVAFTNLSRPHEKQGDRQYINPVYVMMDSGARGNKAQVRQLCGARGLMAKPNGEILERPILSSFREGLSVLEYFISTHGARKGLADTALKTADAGYMTRKLCDVAMDVIITSDDEKTTGAGIEKTSIYDGDDEIVPLVDRIIGRCASKSYVHPQHPDEVIIPEGEIITEDMAVRAVTAGIESVRVMSPLTHLKRNTIPSKAYGIDPSTQKLVERGTAVGIIAAQSIGEPGTQLTMRTFHVGGIASGSAKEPTISAKTSGIIKFENLNIVDVQGGNHVVLNKNGIIRIMSEDGKKELEDYNIVVGSVITKNDGDRIAAGEKLAQWNPHSTPILADKSGKVTFEDMIEGVTIGATQDSSTGATTFTVIDHKDDLNPRINIVDKSGKVVTTYAVPTGAQLLVAENSQINSGVVLAKTPRKASKTQDITGGLPRVAELFEARRPKEAAEMSKLDGIVSFGPSRRGKKVIIIKSKDSKGNEITEEHLIPHGKNIVVQLDDKVSKGEFLTEGSPDPNEILEILGPDAVQEHLLVEIQKVYRKQGVTINDKHIEVIISKMLRKMRITDPGDSDYFWGQQVDKYEFMVENAKIEEAGGKAADGELILLGITKASLETESFISAASFQETTRVLTEAATLGKVDKLEGFKENVIMGNLIPAGTGLHAYRKLTVNSLVDEDEEEYLSEAEEEVVSEE
ncbi:MAG: DNA-directed RNA polymerase subunit beta' [Opitutales bacterium]